MQFATNVKYYVPKYPLEPTLLTRESMFVDMIDRKAFSYRFQLTSTSIQHTFVLEYDNLRSYLKKQGKTHHLPKIGWWDREKQMFQYYH